MSSNILEMKQIEIQFPGVKALDKVDFSLKAGEIHSLLGENGAGKSTLIKCLTGVNKMDAGTIILDGQEIHPQDPGHAMTLGISTVFQEINLCPNLSVAENIFVGRQPMKYHQINWREINRRAEELLSGFGLKIDVTRPLSYYSTAIQQMVSIARAVDVQAKILILDEPTSSLDTGEVQLLFRVMRELKAQGMGIIFITHFLDQVYEVSDRMTILRNGHLVGTFTAQELDRAEAKPDANIALQASHLGVPGKVEDFSLNIREGELVGFAGLLGSGRTETAQMLFGDVPASKGSMKLEGHDVKIDTPSDALNNRMAFCPEDRKKDGIISDLSIRENIFLALQARRGFMKPLTREEQNELAGKYIKLLGIATPDAEKKIGELSGGNQQKVILARWMATQPAILILDEPTRGIDIGAKAEIQKLMLQMCEEGSSVIFISSELDEIIRCSGTVVVMRDRKKVAELAGSECTQQKILEIIAGAA